MRDATQWGPRAPQSNEATPFRRMLDIPFGEDCLSLNVFTPALGSGTEPEVAAHHPVMVWIHGGAFNIGAGSLFDAAELSRRGNVVVVTVNYRLGALGFSYLDHLDERFAGSGNVALLDQIAALGWVRDNIAAFGGDPANVTIFGESAGGHSVGCLLTVPEARGLFHRAIAQSGAGFNLREVDQALAQTTALMDQLGVTSVEELQAVPVERLVDAQAGVLVRAGAGRRRARRPRHRRGRRRPLRRRPAADLPHPRRDAPVRRERTRLGPLPATDDELADRFGHAFTDGAAALAAYRAAEPDASSEEIWLSYLTDTTFHMPDFGLAEARLIRSPLVWMARFSWPATALDGQLGACHAIEIPFLFTGGGNLGGMTPEEGPPEHLAHAIQDAWVAFARNGDPNTSALPEWPRYETDAPARDGARRRVPRHRRPRRRHPSALARYRQRLRTEGRHPCAQPCSKPPTSRS